MPGNRNPTTLPLSNSPRYPQSRAGLHRLQALLGSLGPRLVCKWSGNSGTGPQEDIQSRAPRGRVEYDWCHRLWGGCAHGPLWAV
jgi:hypothetical protein